MKDDALKAIADEAAKVSKDIDADTTLDNATKATQKDNVAKEATKATENIKAATDKQAVDDATKAGIEAIDAQHVASSKTVDVLKDDALKAIADEAAKVSKDIDADATLDNATKAVQKDNVAKEVTKATESIKAATDKQAVDDATKAGITAIDAQHVSGAKTVPVLKDDALQAIADEAAKVSEAIDADVTLDNATKATQKNNVAKEATKATDNIKAATDKQAVDDATKAGVEAIDAQHISGSKTVDVLKDDALKAIADEAAKVSKAIDADATLDNATKAVQKDNVAKAAAQATENVKSATDKQTVADMTAAGIQAIDAQHVPGTKTIAVLKDEALQAIADEAAAVKATIDQDVTLDNVAKATQKHNVDVEAQQAVTAIKAANDAQGIQDATAAGIKAIDAQYVPGQPLQKQQDQAKTAIDQEAQLVKDLIAKDPTLTDGQKADQTKAIDEVVINAKKLVDQATNAQGVKDATDQAKKDIHNQYQPGGSLVEQQNIAKSVIDQEAQKVKNQIAKDPTLTDSQKADQTKAVDDATLHAKQTIDSASNAQDVKNATTQGIAAIDSQYQPGTALSAQQTSALHAIEREAAKIKGQIDADVTLDDAAKNLQKANVDKEVKQAADAINSATDAQTIVNATSAGIKAIDAQYVPGTTALVDQQKAALQRIEDEAAAIKAVISQDKTLDNAAKEIQRANVDREAKKAHDSIKAATNAQGVKVATEAGIKAIDAQYVPGTTTLADQQKAAVQLIANEGARVKGEIDRDPTLDDAEKAVQKANVDREVQQATANINTTTDAQGVKNATADGVKAINAQHVSGTKSVDNLKHDANTAIDNEAAKVKQEIANDSTLDDATKQIQTNNVDQEAVKAKSAINAAIDKQGVANAQVAGIQAIDAQHVPGKPSAKVPEPVTPVIKPTSTKPAALPQTAKLTSDNTGKEAAVLASVLMTAGLFLGAKPKKREDEE